MQTADIQNTKWNEWHTFKIQDIEVKDGTCTIGVTMDKMTTEMIRARGRERLGIKGFSAERRESREVAA